MRNLFVAVLMLFTATSVQAISPESPGEPVQSIPQADRIVDWTIVDGQRVLVNDNQNSYLMTLKHQCHGLSWAQNVSVSMSNNTIWAGFDTIRADGLRCPIDRIWRLEDRESYPITN